MNQELKKTSTLAIISLVCGITSWFAVPLVCGIAAVITGHMARTEIRNNPGTEGGGLAVAGLVLGYTNIALIVLSLLVIFLFLGGMAFFAA